MQLGHSPILDAWDRIDLVAFGTVGQTGLCRLTHAQTSRCAQVLAEHKTAKTACRGRGPLLSAILDMSYCNSIILFYANCLSLKESTNDGVFWYGFCHQLFLVRVCCCVFSYEVLCRS